MLRTLEQRFAEFDECEEDTLELISRGGPIPQYLADRYRAFRRRTAYFYTSRDLAESATTALVGRPSLLNDIGSVIVYLPGRVDSGADALPRGAGNSPPTSGSSRV